MSFNSMDITRNTRIIENLKSELLNSVAHLYSRLADDYCDNIKETALDTLSNVIIISYLLSRRLGLDYPMLEKDISAKIRLGLVQEHETEKYFGDLSALSHFRNRKASSGNAC
ncbi:MAG: hypothetical protein GX027_01535 [Clostridiaceae bacterium]|jgi:hypothetical protein|nr:hypothetical protein [Clostridiaceae bacterium]